MSNVQRLTVSMAQDGGGTRDKHSIVMLVRPDGAPNVPDMAEFVSNLADTFAGVLFARTIIKRISLVQIGAGNITIPETNFTRTMSVRGATAFPDGATYAPEYISLFIERSTDTGKSGALALPHCLTAAEFATFQLDGTIPARFTASESDGFGTGDGIAENLLAAAAANNYTLQLPPKFGTLGTTYYPVTACSAASFGKLDRQRKRISPDRAFADAAQRKLHAWQKQVRDLIGDVALVDLAAAVVTVVTEIIAVAVAYYAGLPLAIKALIPPPEFPALP